MNRKGLTISNHYLLLELITMKANLKVIIKTGQTKKETLEDDFSKRIRPYQGYQTRNNLLSSESNKRNDLPPNGKLNNGINRNLTRGENITPGPIQRDKWEDI
ncbi:hypothetical protein CEXT_449831 [Caerostris extrusa]|uniref:Uncharacterized protein n=1 Tax=Caerostris extrusa TaxID=172846 RepID=A0AAV4SPQ6_CAEEX|nr:hypothetical protein CEXT_449831 [Caerostris extrusa]